MALWTGPRVNAFASSFANSGRHQFATQMCFSEKEHSLTFSYAGLMSLPLSRGFLSFTFSSPISSWLITRQNASLFYRFTPSSLTVIEYAILKNPGCGSPSLLDFTPLPFLLTLQWLDSIWFQSWVSMTRCSGEAYSKLCRRCSANMPQLLPSR